MASGWWDSTYTNLALVSPVDFAVNAVPQAPRGYPKVASIATGAGLYLGGTPCVNIGNIMYYAGDDYVQDTDEPPIVRWDGRIATVLAVIPDKSAVPAKAILSMTTDTDDNIYISTWDSGTTSSNFAGRVFKYTASTGVLAAFGSDVFSGGRLPYSLCVFNSKLYVGTMNVDPASKSLIRTIDLSTQAMDYVEDTSTTTTYKITSVSASGAEGAASSSTSVTTAATLDSEISNAISWTAVDGAATYNVYRTAGHSSTGVITNTASTSFTDDGDAGNSASSPSAPSTVTPSAYVNFDGHIWAGLSNDYFDTPTAHYITFYVTATKGGVESYADYQRVYFSSSTIGTAHYNTLQIYAVTDTADTVNIYIDANTFGFTQGLLQSLAPNAVSGTVYSAYWYLIDGNADGSATRPKVAPPSAAPTVTKTNPYKFPGGCTSLKTYGVDLYAGMHQVASSFATVQKITTADVVTTSKTADPGGSAAASNAITAMVVYNSNLYAAYWNDDATDICEIYKYTGSAWSTVKTISGAGARPFIAFYEVDNVLYVYGGGDAQTGILYKTSDGATWDDVSSLLPSSLEAVPFIGHVHVIGGF